jgi:hypothetical protein
MGLGSTVRGRQMKTGFEIARDIKQCPNSGQKSFRDFTCILDRRIGEEDMNI